MNKKQTPIAAIRQELKTLEKARRKVMRDDAQATLKRDRIQREIDRERNRQARQVAGALKKIGTRMAVLDARLKAHA